jgi:SAM-dependent methyltransferase
MMQTAEYGGRRILEAMHEAVRYSEGVYELVKRAKPAGAGVIMEFGAGDGTFVKRFGKDNVSVDCVEIDPNLRELLRRLGGRVFRDILEVEDESCDFVYTINVLEHIADLESQLHQIRRVLRRGGTFFVFVPAFKILWTSLDDEVGHVTRFTHANLKSALDLSGFSILRIEYFDSLGFPAALAVRFLEMLRIFRYSPSSVRFYDQFIFPLSRCLDKALSRVVGKNLIAVARK